MFILVYLKNRVGTRYVCCNYNHKSVLSSGGGLEEEGEFIEVLHIPKTDIESFIYDETKPKPSGCIFAVLWWLNKFDKKSSS